MKNYILDIEGNLTSKDIIYLAKFILRCNDVDVQIDRIIKDKHGLNIILRPVILLDGGAE
jgi:hypothetical protein